MRLRTYVCETRLDAPVDAVFGFFSDVSNLEALTPRSLGLEVVTERPIEMRKGAQIELRARLLGFPLRWTTEIVEWEPGVRFVDTQRKGPYRVWVHEHSFVADGEGTKVIDKVIYSAPGGFLSPLLHALFIDRQVQSLFAFRAQALHRMRWAQPVAI